MADIIVIGGGPAGMTAALYALRNGKSVLILEKHGFGGQITYSPKVENWPGTAQMSGNEFADALLDQVMAQGAEVDLAEVLRVEDRGEMKAVFTDDGKVHEAKALIIATGVKHRMLGLPGENELVGEGISFCAVCDGDFYSGQTVCVAGGGNSALQEAILLAGKCSKVIMLQDLPEFTGEKKLQEILFARENVEKRTGVKITGLETENGEFRQRRSMHDEDPRRVCGGGLPEQKCTPADHGGRRRRHGRAGGLPVYRRAGMRFRALICKARVVML